MYSREESWEWGTPQRSRDRVFHGTLERLSSLRLVLCLSYGTARRNITECDAARRLIVGSRRCSEGSRKRLQLRRTSMMDMWMDYAAILLITRDIS